MNSKAILGIDLGTTNCAVARVENAGADGEEVKPLSIPQWVNPGEYRAENLLPSFLYLPTPTELPDVPRRLVGELARKRGTETQGRLVASAKSWLSYSGVDRNSAFLPLGAAEGIPRLSPVEASQAYLEHLSSVPEIDFGNATVLLTVPASFDAVARELTEKAARRAGIEDLVLLEEPQAAFYAWLAKHADWRERIGPGSRVLVVDIGGGTTDFTLIDVKDKGGELALERVAVGEHILLGGDNMDLALARHVEAELAARNTKLDAQQLLALWQQCRAAKEALLDPAQPAEEQPVTILGRGSSLIGGTIKAKLSRSAVEQLLVEGFFPQVPLTEIPAKPKRAALQELSLPYAADARITAHLAKFLADAGALPTHVLFNGGVLRAGLVRERLLAVLRSWARHPIELLDGEDLMLAVARGAAYYGLVRQGKGIRIRGGIPRTYYVGIEDALPAVPGFAAPMKAFTVAPFGMEEGASHSFPQRKFGLYVGEPVEFRLFTSASRRNDLPGDLLEPMPRDLEELPPMEFTLEASAANPGGLVPVTLESRITETGSLEIFCVSQGQDRWKLEFNIRERK
ncbi:MAG: Hsp70 family protein [Bryobacter sp.]|nr:Hsp70 family protein [Bryobacter sp.]